MIGKKNCLMLVAATVIAVVAGATGSPSAPRLLERVRPLEHVDSLYDAPPVSAQTANEARQRLEQPPTWLARPQYNFLDTWGAARWPQPPAATGFVYKKKEQHWLRQLLRPDYLWGHAAKPATVR
jgi:hypothetical protein